MEEINLKSAGGVSSGDYIHMRNSSTNNQLLAHEMGHCLGMDDQLISNKGLMYASNSNVGNVPVARLGATECSHLLSACGFRFKMSSPERNQCKNIITQGIEPVGFKDAILSETNLRCYENGTKKFRK